MHFIGIAMKIFDNKWPRLHILVVSDVQNAGYYMCGNLVWCGVMYNGGKEVRREGVAPKTKTNEPKHTDTLTHSHTNKLIY